MDFDSKEFSNASICVSLITRKTLPTPPAPGRSRPRLRHPPAPQTSPSATGASAAAGKAGAPA
jgi:hypothetical protein